MDHSHCWADVLDPFMDRTNAWADIQATTAIDRRAHNPQLFSDQASHPVQEVRAQEAWSLRQMALTFDTSCVSPPFITRETRSIGAGPVLSPFWGFAADSREQLMWPSMITNSSTDTLELARRIAEENSWSNTEEYSNDDMLEAIRRSEDEAVPLMESVDTLPRYEEAAIKDPPPSYYQRTGKKAPCKSFKLSAVSNNLAQKARAAHQYLILQVRTMQRPKSMVKNACANNKNRSSAGRPKPYEPLLSDPSVNA